MNKLIIKTTYLIAAIAMAFASLFVHATQSDLQQELNEYIKIFSGDNYEGQRTAMGPLGWSGHSDPRLYDVIEKKLNMTYLLTGKENVEKASWFAKTLALSGNEKYRATLEKVANQAKKGKVRKHAKTALLRLDKYKNWNPKISKGLESAPAGKLEEARVVNMLNDSDPLLVVVGAKRVYYAHKDNKKLVGMVSDKLTSGYKNVGKDDNVQADVMAWFIRVLAETGDSTHKPTLVNIAETADNKKVRKYAKKYMGYL